MTVIQFPEHKYPTGEGFSDFDFDDLVHVLRAFRPESVVSALAAARDGYDLKKIADDLSDLCKYMAKDGPA
jgi:hypothetical protein